MQKLHAVALAGLLLAVGCGDDDGDGTGVASGASECERICTRGSSHHCGDTSAQECMDACMTQATTTPTQCNGQVDAFLRCAAKADYSCDDTTGNAVAIGCLDELSALQTCVVRYGVDEDSDASTPLGTDSGTPNSGDSGGPNVCTASLDDDACDRCINSRCCAEESACSADAGCLALSDCLNDCAADDDSCQQSCLAKANPSALSLFSATLSCFGTQCSDECNSDTNEPGTDAGANNGEPEGCLPTSVPDGYCTDAKRPVGHECHNVTPPGDCVALENVSDVFCCAS